MERAYSLKHFVRGVRPPHGFKRCFEPPQKQRASGGAPKEEESSSSQQNLTRNLRCFLKPGSIAAGSYISGKVLHAEIGDEFRGQNIHYHLSLDSTSLGTDVFSAQRFYIPRHRSLGTDVFSRSRSISPCSTLPSCSRLFSPLSKICTLKSER